MDNIITIQDKSFGRNTQKGKIVSYMLAHGNTATVREIFEELGINSPTKRLSELRAQGIVTEEDVKVMGYNKEGNQVQRTHYSRYHLELCDAHDKELIKYARHAAWEDIVDEDIEGKAHSKYAQGVIHRIVTDKYRSDEYKAGMA